ncbi:hypothetical protein P9Z86_35870 [Bacillus thuringiensis]|nr:hypothetical protein [Bacillus thuringiensis]MEC3035184.1 hypothetical protein [Bacillus thuringiensis]
MHMQYKEIDQQFIEQQMEKDLFEDVLHNQENPVEFFYKILDVLRKIENK